MGSVVAAALGPREQAVLDVLVRHRGGVVDRPTLRHEAGLDELSPRRCDSVLVGLRRLLGPGGLITVRQRGWRLSPEAVAVAMALVAGLG